MAINYYRSQKVWDSFIKRNGGAAILRRPGLDQLCWALITDYTPIERLGKLFNPTDRHVFMSVFLRQPASYLGAPVTLQTPKPDLDVLVFMVPQPSGSVTTPVEDVPLHIYAPLGQIGPANLPVMWDLRVRR